MSVDSYLESYAAVLLVDDDDANPATRSPNHCLITTVFARHGLAEPESCEDNMRQGGYQLADIRVLLIDAGPEENSLHLVAAAQQAQQLQMCLASVEECLRHPSLRQELEKIGEHPVHSYFKTRQAFLVGEISLLSLLDFSTDGQLLGAREFKVYGK